MRSERDLRAEDVHYRVLRLLQENPGLSQRELARSVGVSAGSIHYILKALVEKGLVKFGNFSAAPDKRRYAYILTPSGLAQKALLTRRFLLRKMSEYHALRAEIETIGAELPDAERRALQDGFEDPGAWRNPQQMTRD